ncbi:MAG: glutathione S-transferase family protein [Myxococcales bacterium]|nr:MAG: glutathione S-transferase family protein [Myxococcales bacterium]
MSLVFYYAPMSTAEITRAVLAELGVPHEVVTVDLKAGGARTPEFLQLNPNGKVPVVVHDGEPVFESVAITIYLGETFGVVKGLFPAPGKERAKALKWLVWAHVSVGSSLAHLMLSTSPLVPAEQHNAKAGEAARAQVERLLGVLDQALTGVDYLVGNRYSLVDTHLASFVGYVQMVGVDLTRFTAIGAWLGRCQQRPSQRPPA